MESVAVARHAMATRFEIVLQGENPISLQAAGEEALNEVERLEAQLSLYRPTSEIAHINARAARERMRVEPRLFSLLQRAAALTAETSGAFDITIGPLMRCWGFQGASGQKASLEAIQEARACTGMNLVELDPRKRTVHFARPGVMMDLGAIGKGYALEIAAEVLREAGVTRALLHGGTSTVCAIGQPVEFPSWKVAIVDPRESLTEQKPPLAVVELNDESLSVSAVWGKAFSEGDRVYGHVLDPRSGEPVGHTLLAAVVLPSATESDALSTALLTLGPEGLRRFQETRPSMRTLLAAQGAGELEFHQHGISIVAV